MNRDVCGFSFSFLLHAGILGAILYLCPALDLQPKTLVIDFSLIPESVSRSFFQAPAEHEQTVKQKPVVKAPAKPRQPERLKPIAKVLTRPVEKILPKKAEKVVEQEPLPEPKAAAGTVENPAVIPVSQPQTATMSTAPAEQQSSSKAESTGAISSQAMEQQYVKAHFIYIKKIIEKNISYPAMARRMGWQGKVVVSFVVCQNGAVENLQVVESSGYAQLDKNALATIRQVEPFPSPPVRVKLVLPVMYKIS